MRWTDRIIAIVLGLVLGAAVVVGFVFWGSNALIDSASLGGDGGDRHGRQQGQQQPQQHHESSPQPPVETVHVIGCAPPLESGPPTFDYQTGDQVRLKVISDSSCGLELVGYGITRTVPANQPTLIEFQATKPGSFPLIDTASHIGVADIRIGGEAVP